MPDRHEDELAGTGPDVDGANELPDLGPATVTASMVIDGATIGMEAPLPSAIREVAGSKIGPYRLVSLIGEGGFGKVFAAEQEYPMRRKVALKVIKLGMDSADVVGRFEQERQALAWMDHPNIAKVLDAGTTDWGRPYFVMEYCPGENITSFCDRQELSIEARLQLFVQVCKAIQHAHQKGLIHRDIKPGNVLVAMVDGQPAAKVIDFGIAKAVSAPAGETAFVTQYRHMIGTPEYMSPEQAEGQEDIDTRTDVYSLGVVLYELISGATPLNAALSGCKGFADVARVIREVDPLLPSAHLNRSVETLASVATLRKVAPKELVARTRGELDWIVMRAIEKDRGRRYETANGLALEVQRFLDGKEVLAVPPSQVYRLRKFVRRHKVGVTGAVAVALALIVGLAATVWQAREAAAQRDLAQREAARADDRAEAARRAETIQRQLAESESRQRAEADRQRTVAVAAVELERKRAEELRQVSDFQAQMLSQMSPPEAGEALMQDLRRRFREAMSKAGVTPAELAKREAGFRGDLETTNATDAAITMIDRNILQPAIREIDTQFRNQPAVQAALQETIAVLLRTLGRYDEALPIQSRALATRRRVLGGEHPDTLASLDNLGKLLQARGQLKEAEEYFHQAIEGRRRVLGSGHRDTLSSMSNFGFLRLGQARLQEAESTFRQVLSGRQRTLGAEHPDTLESLNHLSVALRQQDRLSEAETLLRQAVEKRRRVLGEEHPDTLVSIGYLGALLRKERKLAEAEPLLREALEKRRRVLGETHPETLASMNNLGQILRQDGKYEEAQIYLREAFEGRRRSLGPEHPSTLVSMIDYARLLEKRKQYPNAESMYRFTVVSYQRQLGARNWRTADARMHLSGVLVKLKRYREAEAELNVAESVLKETLGVGALRYVESLQELVKLYGTWLKAESNPGLEQKLKTWESAYERASAAMGTASSEDPD